MFEQHGFATVSGKARSAVPTFDGLSGSIHHERAAITARSHTKESSKASQI